MPSKSLVLSVLSASLLLGACQKSAPEKISPEQAPAAASAPRPASMLGTDQAATPKALFDTVWARARRGDTLGLVRLMVNDSAFRRNVYPVSPAYDSTRESVFRFVLDMHKTNSSKGLKRLLFDASVSPGVQPLRLPFADTVKTREGSMYTPADYAGTKPGVQLFGTVLCRAGGCQVVSYAPAGAKGD